MEGLLGGVLHGRRRDSYSGDVARRHDELEAERLIGLGLEALGLDDEALAGQAKGSAEKYACSPAYLREERLDQGAAGDGYGDEFRECVDSF